MLITLDRFAAYTSARDTLTAIQRATAAWPRELAAEAEKTATSIIAKTVQAIEQEPTSAERRRWLRDAMCDALVLASMCDLASKHGLTSGDLDELLRTASRTVSMLGMSFHATAAACD